MSGDYNASSSEGSPLSRAVVVNRHGDVRIGDGVGVVSDSEFAEVVSILEELAARGQMRTACVILDDPTVALSAIRQRDIGIIKS